MNYCGIPDVRFALVEAGATTGTNTAADMDDQTIDDSIAEASSQVDIFISGPYRPDLQNFPPMAVKYLTRDVAAFLATCTWRKSKDFTPNDPVILRYNLAIQQLTEISNGNMELPGGGPIDPSASGATVVNQNAFTLFYPWQFDLTGRGRYGGPGAEYFWWQN